MIPRNLLLAALLCATACGQEMPKHSRLYRWSVAVLAASTVADCASSMGGYELNPVLGRGRFGGRQMALAGGITGGLMLTQWLVVRRNPQAERPAAVANFAAAGLHGWVAQRNWRLPR